MGDSFISQTLFSGPFATVHPYQTGSTNEESGIAVERHKSKPSSGVSKSLSSYGGSCKVCRMKKIKCDRRTPCSNCLKSKKHCLYVSSSRVRRRSRDDKFEQSIQRLNEMVKHIERSQSGLAIGVGPKFLRAMKCRNILTTSQSHGKRWRVRNVQTQEELCPRVIREDCSSVKAIVVTQAIVSGAVWPMRWVEMYHQN